MGFGKDNNVELQKHALKKFYDELSLPYVHEIMIKIGSFVISEYSSFSTEYGLDCQQLFEVLNKHFNNCSEKGQIFLFYFSARQMLLNAFAKLSAKYPDLRD